MREIKFRGWDGQKMNYSALGAKITPAFTEFGIDFPASYSPYWSTANTTALMQFTGVKDRNGKEIYEGDVVLIHNYNTAEAVALGGASPSEMFEVLWLGSFWSYGAEPILNWTGTADVDTFAEVVGNVYENPDLLSPEV